MSTTITIDDIKLIDTIGDYCVVRMPKGIFSRFRASFLPKKKSKYDILMEARQDALSSKGYTNVNDLFDDLNSD